MTDAHRVERLDLLRGVPHRVTIKGRAVGGPELTMWCGPCAIETREQIRKAASFLQSYGVQILRGGSFKLRTSPASFQGLGEVALRWLAEAAGECGMLAVSEILEGKDLPLYASYVDIIQIGARNMHNYPLLRAVGRSGLPVLLKRGMSATIEEWLLAASYILREGNERIILCERGIRTFEPWTRNTLDLSAIPLAKQACGLPVIADLSHALGRTDVMSWLARAALAAGADGIMCEVHPDPSAALSDGPQSLNFPEFDQLWQALEPVRILIEAERAMAQSAGVEEAGKSPAGPNAPAREESARTIAIGGYGR